MLLLDKDLALLIFPEHEADTIFISPRNIFCKVLAAKDKDTGPETWSLVCALECFESGFNEEPDLAHKAVMGRHGPSWAVMGRHGPSWAVMGLCIFIIFTFVKAERCKVVRTLSVGRSTICHILSAFWFLIPEDVFPFYIL